MKLWRAWTGGLVLALLAVWPMGCVGSSPVADGESVRVPTDELDAARQQAAQLAAAIRRADYAGDRDALRRLYEAMDIDITDPGLASRVHYWRGFALWRKALNGFNESEHPQVLEADLRQAAAEFRAAQRFEPGFADAQAGEAACLANLGFLMRGGDTLRARELLLQSWGLLHLASAVSPDNPRVLWVLAANQFYAPAAMGGGQAVGHASYSRALELARRHAARAVDPLEPAWGEPETLMMLAFTHFNQATPDVEQAERYARAALALVPDWHYVRDVLLVQIREAQALAR